MKNTKNGSVLNYRYRIEIDGIELLGFQEMSELANETEVYEYKEGGLNAYTHKFPTQTSYSNLELKHGLGTDYTLYEWRQQVLDGQMDKAKKNGVIKLYGRNGVSKVWSFSGAWPAKLEIGSFDATASDVVIESIELVIERFERKN